MIFGKHINKYYLRYLHFILLGIAALLLVDIFQLMIPELYRTVINGIIYGEVEIDGAYHPFDLELVLGHICLPMLLISLAIIIGRFLWRICLFGSAIRVETSIRREMFDVGKNLSQDFYQRNKVGNLMSLFTNDLETVQECFGDGLLMFFDALLLGALAIAKMARMDGLLTLLSVIPMAFLFLTGFLVRRYMMQKWTIRQEAFSSLSDFSQESFSGIAVVKAFVKEFRELYSFRKLNKDNEKANVDFTRASALLHLFVTLFVESVICIILGYGGYLVYSGEFSGGELVEFIGYFTSIVWPVMAISRLIELGSRGRASLNRIGEFLDTTPTVSDNDGASDIEDVRGDIEIRSLSFAYPGSDREALRDVSLKIRAGENIGIIGRTGAGKTTLADLLLRVYNVDDGCIFVDGRDINGITVASLRRAVAYVPQDNFLFSDTIGSNIAFGTEDKSTDRITGAAKLADVHGNISEFPMGYDTVLGERGVTVSGGQKQRISIARALMKDAPILILDDSVSAVDTKTEKNILDALRKNREGRTTILIAHRVSSVEQMDRVVFMDGGRILAVGTHLELMSSSEDYRRTVELQRLEDGEVKSDV
ncbi:MAG: ABC transporter ATP-binding protein [Clostridia bacterium]|nr:ABC transporter ATP-binding protein [Clostridia bacterium]